MNIHTVLVVVCAIAGALAIAGYAVGRDLYNGDVDGAWELLKVGLGIFTVGLVLTLLFNPPKGI